MYGEKLRYIDLTRQQWDAVLELTREEPILQFVIRCWANEQTVSAAAIDAFRGLAFERSSSGQSSAAYVGQITKAIAEVTGQEAASCYIYNGVEVSWSIGYYNARALRGALGMAAPSP